MKSSSGLTMHTFAFLTLAISACAQAPSSQEPIHVRASTPEQLGDMHMASGEYDAALRDYAQQWVSVAAGFSENAPETQTFRERIVGKMAQALARMDKRPAATEYSEFHSRKGFTFIKFAETRADFAKAIKEYQAAVNQSPWVFIYHFQLAVAYQATGQFKFALNSLSLASLLASTDKNRRDVNGLKAEIEAMQEMDSN